VDTGEEVNTRNSTPRRPLAEAGPIPPDQTSARSKGALVSDNGHTDLEVISAIS